jgi:hypothetical protein
MARTTPEAPRRRWPRVVLIVTAVAVLAAVLIIGRRTLLASLRNLGHLDWSWFLLAIVAEGVSLAAFGLSRCRLLRAEGHEAGLGSVMAITYASNALSMSIPFAGTELAAFFSYRQFRRRHRDRPEPGLPPDPRVCPPWPARPAAGRAGARSLPAGPRQKVTGQRC